MHPSLKEYIEKARAKGHEDHRIKADLTAAGWDAAMVSSALKGDDDDLIPPPPPPGAAARSNSPQPVVQSLSTRGLEYYIMFIALGVAAISLGSLLHSNVNNLLGAGDNYGLSQTNVSLASAALVVSLPVLIALFLRLKKAEITDPSLRHDPSRKRSVQVTLIVTFLIGLGNIIFFVYSLMAGSNSPERYSAIGTEAATGPLGNFIHLLITLAIAGGIFAYYWFDEHHKA